MSDYFFNDAHGASFSSLYTSPNVSPLHSELSGRYETKTKARWIGYDPDYGAVDDAGIVMAGDHPYLLVVMSDIDNYDYSRLSGLIQAADMVHNRIS